jgi:hypothetical protein
MNAASRPISPGKTRQCPHCKAMILESLSVCPGCLHHLRFEPEVARRQGAAKETLRVEGMLTHPPDDDAWEYHVVLVVRNERGDEISRQVMTVGALQGNEKRSFTVSVEVLPVHLPPPPPPPKPAITPQAPPPAATTEPPKPKVHGYDLKPPGMKPKKS